MKKILIAGPDNVLEFGWCLMRWQAKLRWLSECVYDKVYVISTKSRLGMYSDFAYPYQSLGSIYRTDMWKLGGGVSVSFINPDKTFCCNDGGDSFFKYTYNGQRSKDKRVVVHMRKKGDGREWGQAKWNEYVTKLNSIGVKIVAIGEKEWTYERLPFIIDRTELNSFQDTVNELVMSDLCVGPSSGPMHLASLCGTKHLVWSDSKVWNLGVCKGTNRKRYEKVWNPFNTDVVVVDEYGWNPPVDEILKETIKCLK